MSIFTRAEKPAVQASRFDASASWPVYGNASGVQKKRNGLNVKKVFGYILAIAALPVVAAVFMFAYRTATTHPYLMIKDVILEGTVRLDAGEIVDAVRPALSGNIFTCDVGTASAVLMANPWVESVSIKRNLPDTISVSIAERTPVAAVQLDKVYLVDIKGYVLEEFSGESGEFKVIGLSGDIKPGGRIDDTVLADALRIRDIFRRDTVFRDEAVYVDMGDAERPVAKTSISGITVRFGPQREEWDEKFLEYLTARKILSERGTSFRAIDLSFKGQVVVTTEDGHLRKNQQNERKG